MRDLLLWQDVYIGSSQAVKDVLASQNGVSHEGSDNGVEYSEESDKVSTHQDIFYYSYNMCLQQNGSKEPTPDVCPEYHRNGSEDSSDATDTETEANGVRVGVTNGNGIERSTDTLVPEYTEANHTNGEVILIYFCVASSTVYFSPRQRTPRLLFL